MIISEWEPEERCIRLGEYIVENGSTVRATAQIFGISKSTVHKDVTKTLKNTDRELWNDVQGVLSKNKAERHLRGGEATRLKYRAKKQTDGWKTGGEVC